MKSRILPQIILALVVITMLLPSTANAQDADTTWVTTFDQDFYNWATPHVQVFEFPPEGLQFSKIMLYYTIACPGAPNDCDPWDRLGHLRVVTVDSLANETHTEITRVITPYDITGGTRPGSCTWELDVTDYESLLHGQVTLRNFIASWIGGEDGWLVTVRFAFIHGFNETEAYKVVPLWKADNLVFGDPGNPVEDHLQPIDVVIDPEATAVKLRAVSTGHGQGNTDNAAEFSYKWQQFLVNSERYTHYYWRGDCNQNTCSPQGGTWYYNRAGWCPGDIVPPWEEDITAFVTPGETASLEYLVQPYENFCRPNNPDCVDGSTCNDCDYNYNGHTPPNYCMYAHLIYYRPRSTAGLTDNPVNTDQLTLQGNYPNPFGPVTSCQYSLESAGETTIRIYDTNGRVVREVPRHHSSGGSFSFEWDGRDGSNQELSSGIYYYEVSSQNVSGSRKMIMLK